MRIVCPSCEAEYDVPDTMLAGGSRKVRCARCAREWAPFAPPPTRAPPPAVFAEPGPAIPEMPPPPRPLAQARLVDHAPPIGVPGPRATATVPGGPPSVAVVIAWLVTVAVIAAGIGVVWLKRPEIVQFWPPAARLFKLFGLD